MSDTYGRDLDLNLLRVFVAVAEAGSATGAAARLYVTQPAISAALRRLTDAVGAPLYVRHGRGLRLTGRGEKLLAAARPHLTALVEAALRPPTFEAATTEQVVRLGLSDMAAQWLLPPVMRRLGAEAPGMRVIVVAVQFRTVAEALERGRVDAAVTVADELPVTIVRRPLFEGRFVCLYDPRQVAIAPGGEVDDATYFAQQHVIVSYNEDLRGLVEDLVGRARDVRCSVPSFAPVGALVDGSALVATVPETVARSILALRPHLATAGLPFPSGGVPVELLWPREVDDDPAHAYLRDLIVRVAGDLTEQAEGD